MSNNIISNFKKLVIKVLPPNIRPIITSLSEVLQFYPSYVFGRGKAKPPKLISIEATYLCNCRCKMCPLYGTQTSDGKMLLEKIKNEKELTLDEYKAIFKEISNNGVKNIRFTGGEPFMRKNMLDIVKLAKDFGIETTFITNGALITKEIAKRLVDLEVKSICFSLDGCEHVHNKIRGPDIFGLLMAAIDYINDEKQRRNKDNPTLSFTCTVCRLNEDTFSDVVKISKDKNICLWIYPVYSSTEIKDRLTKDSFPEEQFIKLGNLILLDSISKVNIDTFYNETRQALSIAKKLNWSFSIVLKKKEDIIKWFNEDDYFFVNKCFSPWYETRISPYGLVYPCYIGIPMGNIRHNSLMDIWNGRKYIEFRKKLKANNIFPFCSKCCRLLPTHNLWNYLPKIGN